MTSLQFVLLRFTKSNHFKHFDHVNKSCQLQWQRFRGAGETKEILWLKIREKWRIMKLRWRFYILENRVRKLQFLQIAHMTRHFVHLKFIYFKDDLLNRLKLKTFLHHIVELVVGKHGVITMRLLVKVRVTFHNVVVVTINRWLIRLLTIFHSNLSCIVVSSNYLSTCLRIETSCIQFSTSLLRVILFSH